MDTENGEREVFDEADGELCLHDPSNYSSTPATNDPGLAYLQDGFPQNNPLTPPYSEAALDEMIRQHHSGQQSVYPCYGHQDGQQADLHKSASASYAPLQLHLNLTPQQPPSQFQIDGGAYGYGAGVLMLTGDEYGEASRAICQEGEVFEYSTNGVGGSKEPLGHPKNFVTECQRRQTFNDKFQHLRSLLPNPNKNDRASIVGDAIEYIKELIRTVKELRILVEKKRCSRQKLKRFKPAAMDDNSTTTANVETESSNVIKSERVDQSLRSSWLQRRCKDTEIDVRIVDDEVTIKLVQRKKIINCLLYVSRTFDELQLDLQHVTGGRVGDYNSFLFNTKISEGSSVYASAIAGKLIEVVDGQYAASTDNMV